MSILSSPPEPCHPPLPFSFTSLLPTVQFKLIQIAIQGMMYYKKHNEIWNVHTCPFQSKVEASTSPPFTAYHCPMTGLTYNFNKIHLKAFFTMNNIFHTYIINPFQSHYWLSFLPPFPNSLFALLSSLSANSSNFS